jgi:hypothetical protein
MDSSMPVQPSETAAEAASFEVPLNLQPRRGQESFEARAALRRALLLQRHRSNAPRTRSASTLAPELLLNLGRGLPQPKMELAWIVRKKPIWSPS